MEPLGTFGTVKKIGGEGPLMQAIHYRYSESELKAILSTLEIIVDTREQKNQHVLDYFRKRKYRLQFVE
ncbi:hypothetical protein BT246_72620 (plasmid) [Bacillus thuringiensis]|uniref:Uncharacterized protein n=1 Tax=Bacillus thuringiensis TaxID=1428 RepID=A0A9W3SJG4_BACTU|nr:hypothetical protein BT246_72620 [Bacillus thuringiensis]